MKVLKKRILPAVTVFLLLCTALLIIYSENGKAKPVSKYSGSLCQFIDFRENKLVILSGGGRTFSVDFNPASSVEEFSLKQDVLAVKNIDSYDGDGNALGNLSVVTENGAVAVSENVGAFCVASGGSAVAYIKVTDPEGLGRLCVFNVGELKSHELASDVYAHVGLAISPDGRSVTYLADYRGINDYRSYVSVDGEIGVEIGENYMPVALSDGGELIYYTVNRTSMYVKKGEDFLLLGDEMDGDIYFNRDHTQIMYSQGNAPFLSVGGAQGVKAAEPDGRIWIGKVLPPAGFYTWSRANGYNITQYDSVSFIGTVWHFDFNSFYVIGENGTAGRICDCASPYFVSDDGRSLAYVKEKKLYAVWDIFNPADGAIGTADVGHERFSVSGDFSVICYLDGERRLCAMDKSGRIDIVSDAKDIRNFTVSGDGTVFYSLESGLFAFKNGRQYRIDDFGETYISGGYTYVYSWLDGVIVRVSKDYIVYDLYYIPAGLNYSGGEEPIPVARGLINPE